MNAPPAPGTNPIVTPLMRPTTMSTDGLSTVPNRADSMVITDVQMPAPTTPCSQMEHGGAPHPERAADEQGEVRLAHGEEHGGEHEERHDEHDDKTRPDAERRRQSAPFAVGCTHDRLMSTP